MMATKLPVLLALMTLQTLSVNGDGGKSGLKTYCLGNEKTCDEFWAPFDNMFAALVGYDLPKGNPFATDTIEDPGLRKQIFNGTWWDEETDDYVVETGIGVREYKMCDNAMTNRAATNMKGYEKAASSSSLTGNGFDLGIEAEGEVGGRHEGLLPPMISVAWQKTKEYEKVRQFLFRTRGAVVISEAQCITHKVEVSHFLTPGFAPAFIEVLKYLEKQDTKVEQTRAFKRFIRDFGTHYISAAYMGSKVTSTVFYSNYERLKYGKQRLYNCTAEFAEGHFFKKEEEKNAKKNNSKNKNKKDKDKTANSVKMEEKFCPEIDSADDSRATFTVFGERPEDDKTMEDWSNQKRKSGPIPLKFELTPVVNLLTVDNIDRRFNISSTRILNWFLPLYVKYCKVFDYDCSLESGCGFDDNCGFEENCQRDRQSKKGYKCQATSWADVPNWPQLPTEIMDEDEDDTDGDASQVADRRSDTNVLEPESPNISWFFEKDLDGSGSLSLSEMWMRYAENSWYNARYQTAIEKLIQAADTNRNQEIDMQEYIDLHTKHPWHAEQIAFMLMNTDSNEYLSRQELLEASKISPDMHQLNFSQKQLENLVDGLMAVGDRDHDGRVTFEEYVHMCGDVFVDNFAPNVFKRVLR